MNPTHNNGEEIAAGGKIILKNKDGHFLMIKREDGKGWDFPGGVVNPDDYTIESGARRETEEETGFEYTGKLRESSLYVDFTGKILHTYANNKNLSSSDYEEIIDNVKNIYHISGDEALDMKFLSTEEIFKMRKNEVFGLDGEKIMWGIFKPFLKYLFEKNEVDSEEIEKLSEDFSNDFGPYNFKGQTKKEFEKQKNEQKIKFK